MEDQIFNWNYSDEQNAKASLRGEGENPYAALPRMVIYTHISNNRKKKLSQKLVGAFEPLKK